MRRVAAGVGTLLVASALIFLIVGILPGNVASNILGRDATPARLVQLQRELGLNASIFVQYARWLTRLLSGNLGNSAVALANRAPNPSNAHAIAGPLTNSFILAGTAALILVPVGLLFGVLTGVYAGRVADKLTSSATLGLLSMPEFVLGTFLIVIFFGAVHLLPPVSLIATGSTALVDPRILVLPVLTLLGISTAAIIRLVRAGVVGVLQQDYVRMARLNGMPERAVIWRYALRNALGPSVIVISQSLQYLLGGIVVTEAVFAYPGIGSLLVIAVTERDATLVEAIAIILAAVYILINIIADLLVVLLVPKLRTSA